MFISYIFRDYLSKLQLYIINAILFQLKLNNQCELHFPCCRKMTHSVNFCTTHLITFFILHIMQGSKSKGVLVPGIPYKYLTIIGN